MQENENKQNTGYIYIIRCKDDEKLIYIGSTVNIQRRWKEHKQNATQSKFKHYLLYNKMSEIGHDRFYIEIYETFIFNFRSELFSRENEVIKLLGTLNNHILTEFTKQKEKEQEKQMITCECGCSFMKRDLNRHLKSNKTHWKFYEKKKDEDKINKFISVFIDNNYYQPDDFKEKITEKSKYKISLVEIYNKFKLYEYYINMNKESKRIYNKAKIAKLLQLYYPNDFYKDSKKTQYLFNYKIKEQCL
jgi:hypothetical protein